MRMPVSQAEMTRAPRRAWTADSLVDLVTGSGT